jgi:hypothetical protein
MKNDSLLIDCRAELIAEKDKTDLYLKNDTHWNYKGAFICYSKLISVIKKDFPELKLPNPSEYEFKTIKDNKLGDLSMIMALPEYRCDYDWIIPKKTINYTLQSDLDLYVDDDFKSGTTIIKNADTTLLKIVLFRDSFSNYFIPLLGNSFSKSTLLWTHKFKKEPIIKEQPDIVVHELVERFIDEL